MICRGCEEEKEETEFRERKDRSGRRRPYCKDCCNNLARSRYSNYKRTSPFKYKCSRIKHSAKQRGLAFDLTPEYLESIWTGVCPVTNNPIVMDDDKYDDYAAELDRFLPDKGYVKGNVNFLSRKANRLKSSATMEDMKALLDWMESNGS